MVTKRKGKKPKMQWYKVDLHLHTPASSDWEEPGTTFLDWLYAAEAKGLDIVAITDHNTVAGVAHLRDEIKRLEWLEKHNRIRPSEKRLLDEYRRLGNKILVLPGFEFTATLGFHILGIFPPETSVRELEFLLLSLNIPMEMLDKGSTEVGATTDVLTAYRKIREAGGLVIAAHANSTHGVALAGMSFGGQTKIAYTQDPNLHALEVTDLESKSSRATAKFFDGSKSQYPRRMHCIQGSDAHRLQKKPNRKDRLGIGDRATDMLLPEPTFEAIKELLEGDDFSRTRPSRKRRKPGDKVWTARLNGPNSTTSFHETATFYGGSMHSVLADVVAFANARGGTIYIGVSGDPHVPPTGVQKPETMLSTLKGEIKNRISPDLRVELNALQSQGYDIVSIKVPAGDEKPYTLDGGHIFLRKGKETRLAGRDEIIGFVKEVLSKQEEVHHRPADSKTNHHERETEAAPGFDTNPPSDGVEIVLREERKGRLYYTVKDLRNGNMVNNVTKSSAKRLWQYAIEQFEQDRPLEALDIKWDGDIGFIRADNRANKIRYDLAQKDRDGRIHVYYGVTENGMGERWKELVKANLAVSEQEEGSSD